MVEFSQSMDSFEITVQLICSFVSWAKLCVILSDNSFWFLVIVLLDFKICNCQSMFEKAVIEFV